MPHAISSSISWLPAAKDVSSQGLLQVPRLQPAASVQHLDTQEGGCSCGCGLLFGLFQGRHMEGCDHGRRLRASLGLLVPAL